MNDQATRRRDKAEKRATRKAEARERMTEPMRRLGDLTGLAGEISLPGEFLPGFMSGREALIRMVPARPATAEEFAMLRDALAVLMETNRALRDHLTVIGQRLVNARQLARGAAGCIEDCVDLAEFRHPLLDDEGGDGESGD